MHARYYSFHTARFLSVDPVGGSLGSSQSWNRYTYVSNNPMLFTDPLGLMEWIGHLKLSDEIDVTAESPDDEPTSTLGPSPVWDEVAGDFAALEMNKNRGSTHWRPTTHGGETWRGPFADRLAGQPRVHDGGDVLRYMFQPTLTYMGSSDMSYWDRFSANLRITHNALSVSPSLIYGGLALATQSKTVAAGLEIPTFWDWALSQRMRPIGSLSRLHSATYAGVGSLVDGVAAWLALEGGIVVGSFAAAAVTPGYVYEQMGY